MRPCRLTRDAYCAPGTSMSMTFLGRPLILLTSVGFPVSRSTVCNTHQQEGLVAALAIGSLAIGSNIKSPM